MSAGVRLLLDIKCTLGEGPWWDARAQRLIFIDGFGDRIFICDTETGDTCSFPTGQHVGCAIPCRDGRVITALQNGLYTLDTDTGKLTELSDVEREIPNNRLNDGKCDSHGRLWFGSMSMTANQPDRVFEVTGSLYKLERGKVTHLFGGVGISNGIAWNREETVMYHVDSTAGAVFAMDFDVTRGVVSHRREGVRIDERDGLPDGMCIDEEDMLWVAHFGGGRVSRWNPRTGACLGEITLPVSNVTSCCFGGTELDSLFITTARAELSARQLDREPQAGGLFVCKPGVRGRILHRCAHPRHDAP